MESKEEKKEYDELNLEPIEIHPEMYSANLFGEKVEVKKADDEEDLIGPKARAEFNIFALTDAIGARKKRDAWVLYQKALASGMAPEEVFYKLTWQAKTMLIAQNTKNVGETDMKPFPYSKAKGFLRNFKPGEIEKFSEKLVLGYHQARRGNGEIETLVEKTLLSL
jgi:hypothetical protein